MDGYPTSHSKAGQRGEAEAMRSRAQCGGGRICLGWGLHGTKLILGGGE